MDWMLRSKLAYTSMCLGLSLLSIFFNYYYAAVFKEVFHIEDQWWKFVQIVYIIWNSVSDLALSYLQDNIRSFKLTATRRAGIAYCSPVLVLIFLMTWFSWGSSAAATGIQLMVVLIFWDTLLTFLCLSSSCLFTEISKRSVDRLELLWLARASSLLGTCGVLFQEELSQSFKNLFRFQLTATIIAVCSLLLLNYAGRRAYTEYDIQEVSNSTTMLLQNGATSRTSKVLDRDNILPYKVSYLQQLGQLFSCQHFKIFLAVNFLQEMHRSFHSNFLPTICDQLLPEQEVPWEVRSSIYDSVYISANLLVILGLPAVGKLGYYTLIRASFVYKVCGGVVMLVLGPTLYPILTTFIICSDSCLNQATFALFCLPLSEIVDSDARKHNRSYPITSIIFGINSFLVKPAFWLSPILLMSLFENYGFEDLKTGLITADVHYRMMSVMFHTACFYPVVLGTVQYLLWSLYKPSHTACTDLES